MPMPPCTRLAQESRAARYPVPRHRERSSPRRAVPELCRLRISPCSDSSSGSSRLLRNAPVLILSAFDLAATYPQPIRRQVSSADPKLIRDRVIQDRALPALTAKRVARHPTEALGGRGFVKIPRRRS